MFQHGMQTIHHIIDYTSCIEWLGAKQGGQVHKWSLFTEGVCSKWHMQKVPTKEPEPLQQALAQGWC